MNRYIALLRAINVGGHRKIKMNDLKAMFKLMGYRNVSTYIQSGNVVFDAAGENLSQISARITKQIEESFGHEVPVILRTPGQMNGALNNFPFEEGKGWKGYISFLMHQPDSDKPEKIIEYSSEIEKFILKGKELHVLINKKTDRKTHFSNNFIEQQLACTATSRNLRTVAKILELARP